MKNYTTHLATQTPQAAPLPELRHSMIPNRAGGWAFEVTDEIRFTRFLILGTAQGTYYAGGRELTREALTVLDRLIEDGKGLWAVEEIVRISESGRAPKPEPAILALAVCLKRDADLETRRAASAAVSRVCRIGTHLASFMEALKAVGRGEGKLVRRALQAWFLERDRDALAFQLLKYRQREGWTARDILRVSHPAPAEKGAHADLLRWAVKGSLPEHSQVQAAREAASLTGRGAADRIAELIRQHRLTWEMVPNTYSKVPEVQRALFEGMPMTATVRQLGRMTSLGVFEDPEYVKLAVARLSDGERLRKARVHPMAIFLAARTYRAGHGDRGKLNWQPVPEIAEALDAAFFASFGGVRPTGRKTVVGVDCSGSMFYENKEVAGIPGLRPYLAAFAFAYVTVRTEPAVIPIAFDTRPLEFSFREAATIGELERQASMIASQLGQGTDCAVPIIHAHQAMPGVEAFLLYTDDETWYGPIHPIEALGRYREKWGVASKVASIAFAAHGYSVRGPQDDAGALAVVGFDAAAPGVIADFLEQALPVIPQLART